MFGKKIFDSKYKRVDLLGSFSSCTGDQTIYVRSSVPNNLISNHCTPLHLIIIHDLIEGHKNYVELIEHLFKTLGHNLVVSTIDLKGHGQSSGVRFHIDNFNEYIFDLIYFFNNISNELSKYTGMGIKYTYLLGSGMGSNVILQTVLEYRHLLNTIPTGLIIINPLLNFKSALVSLGPYLIKRFFSFSRTPYPSSLASGNQFHFLNDLSKLRIPYSFLFQLNTDCLHFLSKNHNFTNSLTISLLKELLKNASNLSKYLYFLDIPHLFLLSGKDSLLNNVTTELYFKYLQKNAQYSTKNKKGALESQLIVYPNMPHNLINALHHKTVFNDICNWHLISEYWMNREKKKPKDNSKHLHTYSK